MNKFLSSLIIVGALSLALRFGDIRTAMQVNQAGLLALRACLAGAGERPAAALGNAWQVAWFQGVAARCAGDTAGELSAWQAVIAASDERLPVLRAFDPNDSQLALEAIQANPQDGRAYLWLADILYEQGQTSEAILRYQQGLNYLPTDGLAWRKLGDLYQGQGDWQRAVSAYDQACAHVDAGKNGCLRAAGIYLDHGMPALAEQRLRESIVQLPYVVSLRWSLIDVLLLQGKQSEAVPYLQDFARQGDEKAIQMLADLGTSSH